MVAQYLTHADLLSEVDTDVPLVVDLDGTLLLTDTLEESLVRSLFRNPFAIPRYFLALSGGRAAFKRQVARGGHLPIETLPRREDLVDLLNREKAKNREIHLVTAADQQLADDVATNLGVFHSTTGSDGRRNLKGPEKLYYLRERFPQGFIYAGDSSADLPVFLGARAAILCDVGHATAASIERAGIPVLARLSRERRPLRDFLRALRPHQWSKNLLIFLPLLLGHAFDEATNIATAALAFVILCFVTSATYLVNDISDLEADRSHPTKRGRVFASGSLGIRWAVLAVPVMLGGAFAVAIALSIPFAFLLGSYVVLTITYSLWIKRIAI